MRMSNMSEAYSDKQNPNTQSIFKSIERFKWYIWNKYSSIMGRKSKKENTIKSDKDRVKFRRERWEILKYAISAFAWLWLWISTASAGDLLNDNVSWPNDWLDLLYWGSPLLDLWGERSRQTLTNQQYKARVNITKPGTQDWNIVCEEDEFKRNCEKVDTLWIENFSMSISSDEWTLGVNGERLDWIYNTWWLTLEWSIGWSEWEFFSWIISYVEENERFWILVWFEKSPHLQKILAKFWIKFSKNGTIIWWVASLKKAQMYYFDHGVWSRNVKISQNTYELGYSHADITKSIKELEFKIVHYRVPTEYVWSTYQTGASQIMPYWEIA